jgi:hypothetical protein
LEGLHVAKSEDKSPDFEEPILSDATLTPVEPIAEAETPVAEAAPTESKPEEAALAESKPEEIKSAEALPEEPPSTEAKTEKPKKKNTPSKAVLDERRAMKKKAAMLYLTLSGLMGVPLILIALAHFKFLDYPIAIALCGVILMPWGLWLGRKTNTVYTAFLGLTVVALLAAVCFLWTELARYKGDIRANEAKQRTAVSAPART